MMRRAVGAGTGFVLHIVLTDGSTTEDLYWVRHTGTDIYYGSPGTRAKHTYHKDGRRHSRDRDGLIDVPHRDDEPSKLQAMRGLVCVITGTGPHASLRPYRPRKGQCAVFIDKSVIPRETCLYVEVGLLSPRRADLVPVVREQYTPVWGLPRQFYLMTTADPWIYVVVRW